MKNYKSHVSEKLFIPVVELIKLKKFDEALKLLENLSDQNSDIVNKLKGSIYLNKKNGINHFFISKRFRMTLKILKYLKILEFHYTNLVDIQML